MLLEAQSYIPEATRHMKGLHRVMIEAESYIPEATRHIKGLHRVIVEARQPRNPIQSLPDAGPRTRHR